MPYVMLVHVTYTHVHIVHLWTDLINVFSENNKQISSKDVLKLQYVCTHFQKRSQQVIDPVQAETGSHQVKCVQWERQKFFITNYLVSRYVRGSETLQLKFQMNEKAKNYLKSYKVQNVQVHFQTKQLQVSFMQHRSAKL